MSQIALKTFIQKSQFTTEMAQTVIHKVMKKKKSNKNKNNIKIFNSLVDLDERN